MEISSISNLNNLYLKQENNVDNKSVNNKSFEDMLSSAISGVNKEQVEGYEAMKGIASGNVTNLQEAVQQIEEAELSLKLGLEVKNKALGAYKEIMRMQV